MKYAMKVFALTVFAMAAFQLNAAVLDELMPVPVSVERIAKSKPVEASALQEITVVTGSVEGAPSRVADESYKLEITTEGVKITAPTEKGVRYANATLAQLKALAGSGASLPAVVIRDWPRFPVRGLMIDCGRNYQSIKSIKSLLDLLADYKMNVFHWHLTDQHGWRLESKKYPELQRAESFSRNVGLYYTQREFVEIVQYAKERGITVIPELDVPGHTRAFRKAFNIDKMNSPGVDKIVCELIDELCTLVPADDMPYVHLGTDEVRTPEERVPAEWYLKWGERVSANGRKVIGWIPGHSMNNIKGSIQNVWGWDEHPVSGNEPYIDSTMMYYINHVDPMELLSAAAYQQPCRFGTNEEAKLGATIGVWHDDALKSPDSLARETSIAPAVVLLSDSFWRGREKNLFHFYGRLPNYDRPEYAMAIDLERRALAHRDKIFSKSDWPFAFVRQTNLRWRMSDCKSGKIINEKIAQATIYPHHFRFPRSWYVSAKEGRVKLEMWVKSPVEQTVGAWIGFTAYSRSSGRMAESAIPAAGEWSRHGSTVEINGEKILAPNWNLAGQAKNLSEIALSDEEYYLREPTKIKLRAGWNHVALVVDKHLPKTWKWVATFIPVAGTSEKPCEVKGLEYSSEAPLEIPESVFAYAPFSRQELGTATWRRLAKADEAADAAWAQIKTKEEYDQRRLEMRKRVVELMGGYPERTPLNPKVVGTIKRDGYSVEKLYFMSRPGMIVTALLFMPDPTIFKAPYPAVAVACGHDSQLSKLNAGYQRGCVLAAKAGIAALIYDPIEQGERGQLPRVRGTTGHNTIGVRELMIGKSMAMTRLWDGMRAIDYLVSRKEIDSKRIGVMGNSGGGTLSSYIGAFDERVKACAPSCYISTLRDVCHEIGPQDAEQNIFGQLEVGFNHAGILLLNDNAMCLNASTGDFFPINGSRTSHKVARDLAERLGCGEKQALIDVPGPHGWKESARTGSVNWMRYWLKGEELAREINLEALRKLDVGFDLKKVDTGLKKEEGFISPNGWIEEMSEFKNYYDILREELASIESKRRARPKAAEVRAIARIPHSSEVDMPVTVIAREGIQGGERLLLVFTRADGAHVPAVLFKPAEVKGAALFVGDLGRGEWADDVKRYFAAQKAVLVADLSGFGEAAIPKRWYAYQGISSDGVAVMLSLLGENLVGLRAGEILALAKYLKAETKNFVEMRASGDAAIPAAHAFAAGQGPFKFLTILRRPPSWSEAFRDVDGYKSYPFSNVVPGALVSYDWVDL